MRQVLGDSALTPSMDVRRVERLTRDVIALEALPFILMAVHEDGRERVNIAIRAADGRTVTIQTASTITPAALRQLVRERLEAEV
jgi:hypothetical protein